MKYVVAPLIKTKINGRHRVEEREIIECFSNVELGFLVDTREDNATDPPTRWFIAETDRGRELKVCFIHFSESKEVHIKTAYEPNKKQKQLYRKLTKGR